MIFVAFVEERYETDLDVEGGEVELFGPFETEEQAEIWAYNEGRTFNSSDFWRVVNTKKVYTGEDKIQRERLLSKLMLQMPREWRGVWCNPESGCACRGCANNSGKLSQHNFEKYEWEAWVKEHPEFCGRK